MRNRLELDPDRLLPVDPATRRVASEIYREVAGRPIVSPHGHVDPDLLVADEPFADPAALLVTPDHYVTRLLHAHGVPLERLGLGPAGRAAPPREVWRTFCEHWWAFRGTPSRYWLETELHDVLGVRQQPSAGTADALFDEIGERLALPELRPRALFERFRIDVLATTDDPASDLAAHRSLAADPSFTGRVLPTFRPDAYLSVDGPHWTEHLARLAAVSGCDTSSFAGFLAALENRRRYFAEHGATATDYSAPDAACERLDHADAERCHRACREGSASAVEQRALRGHLLWELARMSSEDGLVMQFHPGVLRNHHRPTLDAYGADTGHDIPTTMEFTRALRPMLRDFGTNANFRLVLFTVDETTFSRELAPLAGFYPSVYVGAPWWFIDTPDAMRRFRRAVTDSAGFYKTSGFVDDTRAFCSIPARHDTARRIDAGYLAELVTTGVLGVEEAHETALDLVDTLPRKVFRL